MKKPLNTIILIITFSLVIATALVAINSELFDGKYDAELFVDFSFSEGEITHGGTGFLYGLAEPNVPDGNLLYGISPQVLATRVPNGLQHPSGDVAQVQNTFFENGGKNIIIYMQDIYPDWYYSYRADYLETMSKVLDSLVILEHSDKFIYQPFNEMNNGVWYGDFSIKENRYKYYKAYKNAFDLIKKKTGGAPVGGPAYTDYNSELIREFLEFCVENDCIPDVMIWHELVWYSTYGIRYNVEDYRNIEKELGIKARRIIIDEYGTFKDVGTPGNLIQYLSSFEATKTEGCLAFWRLPNNLNDLSATQNEPTSAWWLYHWYSQMSGTTYKVSKSDSTIPYFSGIATIDDEKATILYGGAQGKSKITLENLSNVPLFKNAKSLRFEIEYLDFEGLTTPSIGGNKYIDGTCKIINDSARINVGEIDFSRAYKINVYPDENIIYTNHGKIHETPTRIEAEDCYTTGKYLSYDEIRYASSGGGVRLTNGTTLKFNLDAKEEGLYSLEIVYATNPTIGNIRLNPRIALKINGNIEYYYLDNTLTDSASTAFNLTKFLKKGNNVVEIMHDYGNLTIDFLDYQLISKDQCKTTVKANAIKLNKNSDYNLSYLIITNQSGYFKLEANGKLLSLNNTEITSNVLYLKKGINVVNTSLETTYITPYFVSDDECFISIDKATGASGYVVENYNAENGLYLKDAPQNHEITFNVEVEKSGIYNLKIIYSYGEVSGNHAYNVKLVERYTSLQINDGPSDIYYLANTYSDFNFEEFSIQVCLNEGNNNITFYNDGSHVWNDNSPKMPNISSISINILEK